MKEVVQHAWLGEVTIVRSARLRRVTISIRPPKQVRLSLPRHISTAKGLVFLDERREWIEKSIEKIAQRPYTPESTPEEIEELRKKAKETLPMMCAELSKRTGLQYRSVSVRIARRRWGSCSVRNDISLSLFLMKLPTHLIEYVILHELCHIVHKNHSTAFHTMLDTLLGGREKEYIKEIKGYHPR